MNHKKFFVVSLAIFALVSLACGQNSENVKGNLVSEDATTVKVVDKVVTEQVTQKASTTDDQSSQIDNGEEGTSPKPPMVQYIEDVFAGIQNILGNVADIVKSSFGGLGRQSDNTVHPRQ